MIQLTENITYNTELTFEEQNEEAKEYVMEIMKTTPQVIKEQDLRPLKHIFLKDGIKVEVNFTYKHPITHKENFSLKSETINIQEV